MLAHSLSRRAARALPLRAALSTDVDVLAATHAVTNQARPLGDVNLFAGNAVLRETVAREAPWAAEDLDAHGRSAGSAAMMHLGHVANKHGPVLQSHDVYGRRIDSAEFHPAYHAIMDHGIRHEVHAYSHNRAGKAGAMTARCGLAYMEGQMEQGHHCPLTMTFAVAPALATTPSVAQVWLPRVQSAEYDPRDMPAGEKRGATMGMSMTEKQGGSDVRANTTTATPVVPGSTGEGATYELVGHKWFTSAPMSDAFLTLAQTETGLSCFLVPRWLENGDRNAGFQVMRLKDKLGDRSNASSEVEYRGARGTMVGPEGRGVPTILEMVVLTRLDCTIGSTSIMRQSLTNALNHVVERSAFGAPLAEQPLMQSVLADLAVDIEAHELTFLRLARSFDLTHVGGADADSDAVRTERAFTRLATAVSKYYVCKQAPRFVYEAMECLGGNGYVEDFHQARLFRQSPLNAIWEGSGNIICLDVMRTFAKEPAAVAAFMAELQSARGTDARLDAFVDSLALELGGMAARSPEDVMRNLRATVHRMAVAFQGSLVARHASDDVAAAFFASRLPPVSADQLAAFPAPASGIFGTLDASADQMQAIIARHMPLRV